MTEARQPLHIMLIEDNQDHARILKWAFEQSTRQTVLQFIQDGEEALLQLNGDHDRPHILPDLIFLDLNLPKVDGRKVLQMIKENPKTRNVPVIILSSSDREEDVQVAYQLGANTYVSKSVVLSELSSALHSILDYWTRIARLPSRR